MTCETPAQTFEVHDNWHDNWDNHNSGFFLRPDETISYRHRLRDG